MDTRNMYMEIYGSGCAIGNVYSVPAWAKSERLEYSVSLAEIWRMGESAVGKRERWNLKRFFNNSIKTCLHIVNSAKAKVDRALLMANEKGVRVMNCAMLSIDKDVEPKLICDRLQIKNCAKVSCTEEQESAVHTVSKNVAMIGSNKPGGDGEESGGIMGMMGSVFDVVKQVANTSMINAEKHIM